MLAGITDVSHHTWLVHSSYQAAVDDQKERQSTSMMSLGSQSINTGVIAGAEAALPRASLLIGLQCVYLSCKHFFQVLAMVQKFRSPSLLE